MSIEKIMTPAVTSVELDDTLGLIKDIFEKKKFHHLMVTDGGKLAGIISDRDVLKALSPYIGTDAETLHDAATLNKRAHQVMTRDVVTLTLDSPVLDAVKLFNSKKVSCLPVIDAQRRPIGVVTWRDILRAIEVTTEKRQASRGNPG